MRKLLRSAAISICFLIALLPIVPTSAQSGNQLSGRAVWPNSLADGPQSGAAYAGQKINGLKLPFDTQPVGNVSGVLPGDSGYWLVLAGHGFQNSAKSADFFLRIYTVQINFCQGNCPAGGDQGMATHVDWWTLSDSKKLIPAAIHNASTPDRELTGADYDMVGFVQAKDGSFWIAANQGGNTPTLLHFAASPKVSGQSKFLPLLEAPITLQGGSLVGLGITQDQSTLVFAEKDNSFHTLSLSNPKQPATAQKSYSPSDSGNIIGGIAVSNTTQALVIEQDSQQNSAAKFKQIFAFDWTTGAKTPVVDLLNISDPKNISTQPAFAKGYGVGPTFKFPYLDISGVYTSDGQTLVVVNDNHVPFDTGRTANTAEDTDFITIQLATPLK